VVRIGGVTGRVWGRGCPCPSRTPP
jgi:hypothetical protein